MEIDGARIDVTTLLNTVEPSFAKLIESSRKKNLDGDRCMKIIDTPMSDVINVNNLIFGHKLP